MRVGIAGAGPAGLYLAMLLKRADPRHEVTVVERNPPDATYGWGVVFSEETLSELRDADYPSYVALDAALVRWGSIDIRYRGRSIRSRGHGFSAIARTRLLGVLQERARALGVHLRFNEEVAGDEAFDGADVVVAADGLRSVLREQHADRLSPSFTEHSSRYIWFGTDLVLEVFTFIFRPTEHGLLQVHAYPFDGRTSTFIVECTEDTWRRAGLDTMGEEESLAFCERVFADDLGGHKLLSNRSAWTRFVTVRNRRWHDGNIVLVGDAAHTAHFTIGSGTKLAMEDATALAKAFSAHPADLEAAFAEYELERQAPVERFQDAASDSARYFETVRRYLGFAPEQFAFNLLTRSGRVTHLSMQARDPGLTADVDRWFREQHGAPGGLLGPAPAWAPLTLSGLRLANRVAVSPRPRDTAVDGLPGDDLATDLAAAARTGAGLVVTEPVAVSPHGRITDGSPGIYRDEHVEAWRGLVAAVHGAGAAAAIRLTHAGRRGARRPRAGGVDRPLAEPWPLVAPSPLPYTARSPRPTPADGPALAALRADFAEAAARAAAAGFDALLLDCSDGYLLAGFLSPLSNQRTDAYGGDLVARLRWPLEVLADVRAAWSSGRPLAVRLNADDRTPGGFTPTDAVQVARTLGEYGVVCIDVTAGHTIPAERSAPDYRRLYNAPLADLVRNEAGVATAASGRITTVDEVNTLVAAGRADICLLEEGAIL